MPTLTIKGLPHPLYRRLKRQAEAHRRSLNGEIIMCSNAQSVRVD
jgi:antitoxin FitA